MLQTILYWQLSHKYSNDSMFTFTSQLQLPSCRQVTRPTLQFNDATSTCTAQHAPKKASGKCSKIKSRQNMSQKCNFRIKICRTSVLNSHVTKVSQWISRVKNISSRPVEKIGGIALLMVLQKVS